MASSKGAAPAKARKRTRTADTGTATVLPRPLPAYRSHDPGLDDVLLPLLARAEPGAERPLDLERARARLLLAPSPSDAAHLVALLADDALDLGAPLPPARPAALRTDDERRQRASLEHARTERLAYLAVLLAAACLHPASQERVAAILKNPALDPALRERAALQVMASRGPLSAAIPQALRAVLDQASPEPSAEERNLLSSAARALLRHLSPADALAALRPYLEEPALSSAGGVARAQMILTDLETERLQQSWRPVLGALLRPLPLSSFACDLLAGMQPDPADAAAAAPLLTEQLDRGELPDNYLVWLLARAPHPGASALLLRLLDAGHDPDWATLLQGLRRTGDASAAEPLLRWIERHRERTGRQSSWEGFEAARTVARALRAPASAGP